MKKNRLFHLTLCALFAALTAVMAQVSIPIGPVPICLATLAVYLAGGILGAAGGVLSQVVYLLLGAVGVPVFAFFHGGIAAIAGPTGGYLVGYIVCAWITGIFADHFGRKAAPLVIGMVLGTAWFMFTTKRGLAESLALCVLPFLIGDTAKIVISVIAVPRLFKIVSHFSEKSEKA